VSEPLAPFPDITTVVMHGIEQAFMDDLGPVSLDGETVYRVARGFPLEGPLVAGRFVRVGGIGAPEDRFTTRPTIDVDVFAPSYAAGWDLAQRIHQWLVRYPHSVQVDARSVVLDTVRVSMSPQEVDWKDSRVRRFYSSYQISARR
jgi:hypothetical protein